MEAVLQNDARICFKLFLLSNFLHKNDVSKEMIAISPRMSEPARGRAGGS